MVIEETCPGTLATFSGKKTSYSYISELNVACEWIPCQPKGFAILSEPFIIVAIEQNNLPSVFVVTIVDTTWVVIRKSDDQFKTLVSIT